MISAMRCWKPFAAAGGFGDGDGETEVAVTKVGADRMFLMEVVS